MADQSVTSAVREQLESERDQLAAQVAGLEPGSGASPSFDENFADSGQVAAEQGENKVLASRLRAELDEVERALEKIDSGTYGKCEVCGQPIAEPRLEAMPATRFCIDHA
jgi:RNA polymerase-binding transcription factor DksA